MSAWLDDIKDETKLGSHELSEKSEPKRKLKPRFSVNLSDADHVRVKKYCDDMGISCAALARTLILEKLNRG
jgi:hypothetical protein